MFEIFNKFSKVTYKNYLIVILILLLFFFITIYLNFYKNNFHYNEKPHVIYQNLLEAYDQKKIKHVKIFGTFLINEYPHSSYACFASFFLAKEAINNGNLQEAISYLKFVIENTSSKNLKQLACIRMARILIVMKKANEAIILLKTIDKNFINPMYYKTLGDAFLSLKNTNDANYYYRKALISTNNFHNMSLC